MDIRTNTNVYIFSMTGDKEDHIENLETIRNASAGDTVTVIISTPGGSVDLAESYIAAFEDSAADIITVAVGQIASAGCTVWLHGDIRRCNTRTNFMFHDVSVGWDGDPRLMKVRAEFFERHTQMLYTEDYPEILTPEEIHQIVTGGEVYLTGAEMHQRLYGGAPAADVPDIVEPEGGSEFTITLDNGFRLQLDLDDLHPMDFNVLNREELIEVGEAFGLKLENHSFRDGVDVLTDRITGGISGRA